MHEQEQAQEPTNNLEPEHQQEAAPRIYVASLSDYNAGILHGTWLEVTDDTEQLETGISKMLAASPTTARFGEPAEEWAIHDYEGWFNLRLGEYEAIERLARVADGIARHGEAYAAWIGSCGPDDEQLDNFDEAFLGEHDSPEAFGESMLDDMGFDLDGIEGIPEGLRPYIEFDVAGWVRDMEYNGEIMVVEGGRSVYVFNTLR